MRRRSSISAYRMLRHVLTHPQQKELYRPNYSFASVLELLHEYEQCGYEPIPGWDLESELEKAIDGVNIHLRGVAYRLKAQAASKRETSEKTVYRLLVKSKEDLQSSETPVDLAQTNLELATVLQRRGTWSSPDNSPSKHGSAFAVSESTAYPKKFVIL